MFASKYNIVSLAVCLVSCFVLSTHATSDCDVKTCAGPSYYYQELGCIPIYENASSCCPTRYNCDHWKNLPDTKCFVNGKMYENGDVFPVGEFGESCTRCFCVGGESTPTCVATSCAGPKMGCYLKQTPFECCSTIEVCPEKEEAIPTCNVDGKTYKDGESFTPVGEPEKICYCGAGYRGENIAPYCISHKPGWCGNALFAVRKIRENCAPVYAHDRSPQIHCNRDLRCYDSETDSVMGRDEKTPIATTETTYDSDMMCKFGSLTMRIGEMVSSTSNDNSNMSCTCDVPPVVTCRNSVAIA